MSTGATSRSRASALYEGLKNRVDTVKLPDGLQKDLVSVAKAVLEMYPVEAAASAASAMPEPEQVEELMQSLLPSPVEVFSNSFFRAPLFALVTLYKVADLYNCVVPQDAIFSLLGLPNAERSNKNIAIPVWFADFLGCDRDTILESVKCYKESRGSPDSLRRLSVAPPRTDPPTKRDQPSGNLPVAERNIVQRPESGADSVNRDEEAAGSPPTRTEIRTPALMAPMNVLESEANDSRKATNVFQYFKDNKFTGDLSQSIDMTLRDYNVCARQHRLSARQKADFFINVLSGPARTYFFNNARDDMDFEEMARMLASEYNSDSRQLQVQGMLETLCLDKHMSEHEIPSPSRTNADH